VRGGDANMLMLDRTTEGVVTDHFRRVHEGLSLIPIDAVVRVVDIILEAYRADRHVYVVGNGGSASTATHFACDLSKATISTGRRRLRASSLSDNVALLTAWANDTSYERVFAEQIMNLVDPDDVLVAVSASGNSPNVLAAVDSAQSLGAITVAMVGFDGGRLKDAVTAALHVPINDYGVVEDCHLVLEHAITESVRRGVLA
jgi:D-sedoheptulose 7-phosphate isomerase